MRQAPAGKAQVGDNGAAREVQHQGGGRDPPDDDAVRVGVLEGPQEVPDHGHRRRDRSRAAADRVREALAVDPVRRPVREPLDLAEGVDVADRGMVERREGLGLAHEPLASRRARHQVEAQRHGSLQAPVPRLVQRPLGRQRHELVQAERRLQRRRDAGKDVDGRRLGGHRAGESNGRPPLAGTPGTSQISVV